MDREVIPASRRLGRVVVCAASALVVGASSTGPHHRGAPPRDAAATAGPPDELTAWVPTVAGTSPPLADAMARVPRSAAAGAERAANVYAARGETQGFAIVVKAPATRAVTSLSVAVSALTCTSGACAGKAVPAQNVDAYRAMYQTVSVPTPAGDPALRGRTNANGPAGTNTLDDPGNGSLCGPGRPLGPPPCEIPDGLVPYQRCGDGSAPPCATGDAKRANPCAVDGTACGPDAPALAVAPGDNQEVWIDVRVPRGRASTPAGTYRGTVTLTARAGGARSASIEVNLHVWDFEVPSSPSFKTAFGMNGDPSALFNLEAQGMFAKHRVSLIRYGSTTTMGVDDWPRDDYGPTATALKRTWGVPNALQVGTYHGVEGNACVTSWSPSDYLTAATAQSWVERHGLPTSGVLLYARNSDEVYSGLAEPGYTAHPYSSQRKGPGGRPGCDRTCGWCTYRYLREAARQIHATTTPPIKMLSVVDPNPYLVRDTADLGGEGRPAVDVFVVTPSTGWANPRSVASVRSNATPSELWAYLIWVMDRYSPKWQLDYSPVSYRMGFIAQALGVSGAAVAEISDASALGCDAGRACRGGKSVPPENPWVHGVYKNVCGGRMAPNCSMNGDSQWFYPGVQVGLGRWSVVPHLRLKFFRDGVQDYELVEILKHLGTAKPSASPAYTTGVCPGYAISCKAVVERLGGTDWSDYSTDTSALQRARKAIAERIAADARRPTSER